MCRIFSVHIPKTAGTSFSLMMKEVYKDNMYWLFKCDHCYNYNIKSTLDEIRESESICSDHIGIEDVKNIIIDNDIKFIHGHYKINIFDRFIEDKDKIITWVRNPIDRVISDYFFINEMGGMYSNGIGIYDFESFFKNRCEVISYYLEGIPLSRINFIGIVENYNSEIKRLCKYLGIDDIDIKEINKGVYRKDEYDKLISEYSDIIKYYNRNDMEIYEKIIQFNKIIKYPL